jgi:hypothetical protein
VGTCNLATEFTIPKFIEGSTCFERHTAHHQELQTVFVASDLYTHVVTGPCPGWVGTCNLVTEFTIPKFTEGSACCERHSAHHQELQAVFVAFDLYTHVVTGRCPGWVGITVSTQPGQQPVTTWVYKPEAANTVWSS